MEHYNPDKAPDPKEWLELDEDDRIGLIERYHKKAKIRLPNRAVHAAFHAVVENQIALGDELPVSATLDRLMAEGLSRHDAVHAVAMVLVEHMHGLMTDRPTDVSHDDYYAQLKKLTADQWRQME